jgi:hypothetical protein
MDTDVRTPIPSLPTPKPASGGRRSRLLVASAILVTTTFVAGLVWLANLEPISQGSTGYDLRMGLPTSMARTASVQVVEAFGVDGRVLSVRAEPDAVFTYMVSVRNDGPVPITIRGLSPEEGDRIQVVGMVPDIWASGRVSNETQPFHPFSVSPDGEAALEFQVRIPREACRARGTTTSWYTLPLEYTVLGIEREQVVDLGVEVVLRGTEATEC